MWPLRGRRAPEPAPPLLDAPSTAGWRELAPIQRAVGRPALHTGGHTFGEHLSTWRSPGLISGIGAPALPAPSALTSGLAGARVQRFASRPTAAAVLARSTTTSQTVDSELVPLAKPAAQRPEAALTPHRVDEPDPAEFHAGPSVPLPPAPAAASPSRSNRPVSEPSVPVELSPSPSPTPIPVQRQAPTASTRRGLGPPVSPLSDRRPTFEPSTTTTADQALQRTALASPFPTAMPPPEGPTAPAASASLDAHPGEQIGSTADLGGALQRQNDPNLVAGPPGPETAPQVSPSTQVSQPPRASRQLAGAPPRPVPVVPTLSSRPTATVLQSLAEQPGRSRSGQLQTERAAVAAPLRSSTTARLDPATVAIAQGLGRLEPDGTVVFRPPADESTPQTPAPGLTTEGPHIVQRNTWAAPTASALAPSPGAAAVQSSTTNAAPVAPLPTPSAPSSLPTLNPPSPHDPGEIGRLAQRLYPHLRRHLVAELRADRERVGRLTDRR